MKGTLTVSAHALIVVVSAVVNAGRAVLAGVFRARVVLELASDPGVGGWAGAVESGPEVLALGAVHAGLANATLGGGLAVLAVCALGTTGKANDERNHNSTILLNTNIESKNLC